VTRYKGHKAAYERTPKPESGQQFERSDCRSLIQRVRENVLAEDPEVLAWRELSGKLHRSCRAGSTKWK